MKLLLATLHAKYVHSSLALPMLAASCREIPHLEISLLEASVNERIETILPRLVSQEADIAAFSCYIWNIEPILKLATLLKLVRPGIFIILGGPEVSFGSHQLLAATPAIDCIVHGEGETTFRELTELLVAHYGCGLPDTLFSTVDGISFRSGEEIITTSGREPVSNLDRLPSPFAADLVDTAKPLVYLETSRGCPFSCAFCVSSLEQGVRSFSLERIESDLATLMAREVQTIKLVDRTFNYDALRANRIWEFILRENRRSCFHFEIAADLLTDGNIRLLGKVPPGMFRFEIGIQSTRGETLDKVGRNSNLERLFDNVRRLREETGIVVHLDLVAGLPEEDFPGFLTSLARLLSATPDHIQVEPLKVLKGTAMRRIARENGYAFYPFPPYKILHNPWLSHEDIIQIDAIASNLECFYNSGRFGTVVATLCRRSLLAPLFCTPGPSAESTSTAGNSHSRLFSSFWTLIRQRLSPEDARSLRDPLCFDYCLSGYPGSALPRFLAAPETAPESLPPCIPYPELARKLELPEKSRFRTFTTRYERDYTTAPWNEQETVITFVYRPEGVDPRVQTVSMPG